MKKSKIILFALAASILPSCGDNSIKEDSLPDDYASSVKSYLKALKNIHNYTVKETVSSTKATSSNYAEIKFSKTNYFYSFGASSYGYIESKDGVYPVNANGDSLLGGEIYRDDEGKAYSSLWDNDFFVSFNDLDTDQIDSMEDGKELVSIKGKANKLELLSMFGLNSSYYASIIAMEASVNDDNDLEFNVRVNDTSSGGIIYVNAIVTDLLVTESEEVADFLSNGGTYFVIDDDFAKARTLMKGNNYTHDYYDEDGSGVVGTEYFNEDYYFGYWDSAYIDKMISEGQLLYSQGLVGIDHKKTSEGVLLNGCYLITISNNQLNVNLSHYYNENPSVPLAYNYPSYLSLWSNPEFFVAAEAPEELDAYYVTDDSIIISDLVSNFGMTSMVANVTLQNLYIGWHDIDAKEGNERFIRFNLETSGGDVIYDFYNFGTTNIPGIDEFLGTLLDQ